MKIEVLLTDQVNENIVNYDENRNLFEANQFEAKKSIKFDFKFSDLKVIKN